MEKYYTLLAVTTELRKSPAIAMYGRFHDVIVDVSVDQIVTFLLPVYVESRKQEDICVLFDPDLVEVIDATVQTERAAARVFTHISVRLIARDIGSTSIGFATPDQASHHIGGISPVYAYHMARYSTV